jgi:hypothetical protein
MEELHEFEVLWPETCHTHEPPPPPPSPPVPVQAAQTSDAPAARSRPVDVPGPKAADSWRWNGLGPRDGSGDHGDDGGNGSAIVPPHLLLSAGWRWSEEAEPAAWTLRASVGPPCKRARDLRHLRDSVLRMTGFIEG